MEEWNSIKNKIADKWDASVNIQEQEKSFKERLESLFEDGLLYQNPEGKKYILQNLSRIAVIANIDGVKIPFYQSSTGTDGKHTGKWYPFFGNKGNWLIKGSIGSMNNGYGIPKIKEMMDLLDSKVPEYLYQNLLNKDQSETFSDSTWKYQVGKIDSVKDTHPEFIIHPEEASDYMSEILKYDFNRVDLDSKEGIGDFITERVEDLKRRLEN